MKKNALIIATAIMLLLFSGCSVQQSAKTNQPAPAPANQTNGDSVIIKNFAFSPETLTVKTGTTVIWTNEDSANHTIKSATFNSGNLATGDKFEFKFDTAGTYGYSCGIHPSMQGKIIVE